ncbi:hypothetical protein POTOM_018404 [Populus tomentosa]|uniref:Uncharacterized protein n=1 Tax=Populus tomentosa TaxID=118781 RepID=A0A8X8A5N3_POPTO|nr:hypothetical protein POTOM_018404 [Populus tomentosa]
MACQSCSSKSACSVEVPKEEVTTQPETVVVQEVESPAVAPQEVKTEEKEDEDASGNKKEEPVKAEVGSISQWIRKRATFLQKVAMQGLCLLHQKEVETGNVKLETSLENKPRYAVPSVSVKAEEKPTVSVKKQPNNASASGNKKEEPVKAEVGSSN